MSIFSLNEVKSEQVKNVANNNFASWPESGTYGYFAGGFNPVSYFPATINKITRLDFSNETASDPGKNLPVERSGGSGVSINFYGYFVSGGGTGNTITRLDFSNETVSDPGKNLPPGRSTPAGVSNNYYGYFGGGYSPPLIYLNTITRLDFSNETVSDPGKNLPSGRSNLAATSTSSYGYFGGGNNPTAFNTISRLDFSNETASDPGKNLPLAISQLAAVSSASFGYYVAGLHPATGNYLSAVARLDFSTENVSNPGKNLPVARNLPRATSSSFYGYIVGGADPPNGFLSTISRLDFTTENANDLSDKLPYGAYGIAALSGGQSIFRNARGFGTYGYFGGGYTGIPAPPPYSKSFVFRFDFSTEQFTPIGNLGIGKYNVSGFSNKDSGYFLGGQFTPGVTYSFGSNKISFSNETISASTPTGIARSGSIGLNSKYCGYLVGGSSTGENNVTKFDYSTESKRSLGDILPSPIDSNQAGVDCGSYGYMTLPFSCTINRLDFSNETISNPGKNRPQAGSVIKGISHTAYGYFAGGSIPGGDPATYYNTFIRLDFSSETTSLPGKNLPSVRRHIATTQSSSYGYCVGGEKPDYPPPPVLNTSEISTISRIDFSTEDVTNIATNFPQNISNSSGISNHNKYNL